MQHPDFELYDNVGRTSEQIAAAHFGIATRDDLMRWAHRDAEPFLDEHPLPSDLMAAPETAPYLAALAAARTPAEVSAVTQHLLEAATPGLSAVSDILVAIARWGDRNRDETPRKMLLEAASRSLSVLALADEADLAVLRDEYDPAPRAPSKAPPVPSPAPLVPPPAGPMPRR